MANDKVTPINKKKNGPPSPEELEQEFIQSSRDLLRSLDHMKKIQELSADYKAVMETALARAEKWWRYENENRDRVQRAMNGEKYEKRATYTDLPKADDELEVVENKMKAVTDSVPEPTPDLTESTGE